MQKSVLLAMLLCSFILLSSQPEVSQGLKVMELMAVYKIRNKGNNYYLTTAEQGILGLRTGLVVTAPDRGKKATSQQWTMSWDPSVDNKHDGYRMESRHEFLNEVTSFYPYGRTKAIHNIWEVIELPDGYKILRNKRTFKCLTVLLSRPDVVERTCSAKNRFQHWQLEILDLDKRLRMASLLTKLLYDD